MPNKEVSFAIVDFSGGMSASVENAYLRSQDSVRTLINGQERGGWLKTRDKYHAENILFSSDEVRNIFQLGKIQGWHYHRYNETQLFYFAVDGNILNYNPLNMEMNLVSQGQLTKEAHIINFSSRGNEVIAQDNLNTPLIIKGQIARQSDLVNQEIFSGFVMADGNGRLALARGRKIYFSNHELDPNSKPTNFSELNDYFANSRYFEVPARLGDVVAMEYMPSSQTGTGLAGLVVFCEFGSMFYRTGVPRTQWISQDIGTMILPTTGAVAPRGVLAFRNDLIFSDHNGHISTLRFAKNQENLINETILDEDVYPLYENEAKHLRGFRSTIALGDKILTTVDPIIYDLDKTGKQENRFNVRHRSIAVLQTSVSPRYRGTNEPVWAGLWQSENVMPIGLAKGYFRASSRLAYEEVGLMISSDSDGINRLYRIKKSDYDYIERNGKIEKKPVTMKFSTGWFDYKNPTGVKIFSDGLLWVKQRTKTKIVGKVMLNYSDKKHNWFCDFADIDRCLEIYRDSAKNGCIEEKLDCLLKEKLPVARPITLPAILASDCFSKKKSFAFNLEFAITGEVKIINLIINATVEPKNTENNVVCKEQQAKKYVTLKF